MISNTPRRLTATFVLSSLAVAISCSDPDEGPSSGVGGSGTVTGGSTSTGGTVPGTGGAPTGGVSTTGGSVSTGGSTLTGGAGSANVSGGSVGTGGSAGPKGGTTATGGSGNPSGGNGGMPPSMTGGSGGAGPSPACASVMPISKSTCTAGEKNCFSFFVASRARMFAAAEAFNGSTKGWGGDFRYGTSDGLTGADKLCTEIAEKSSPGNCRTWRAFLSTSKANAIDRVGTGPWFDRLNRTIANNVTELLATRPGGITVATILNNLPNEDGTPHHDEEVGCDDLNDCADNHDVLTGSDTDGKLCTPDTCSGIGTGGMFPGGGFGGDVTDYTCEDWTLGTSKPGIAPRCGHTWPTGGAGKGGGDDWISHLVENGCAPGYNLVQNGGPMPDGKGSVGDGGGYGAIYCLALSD
jgi:hypothetical protein